MSKDNEEKWYDLNGEIEGEAPSETHHPESEYFHGHLHHNHLHNHYHTPNKPHLNKDGWHLAHWFGDKRHYRPWFDSDADYNTNAMSYYDYLGFRIRQLDLMIEKINELLRRDVHVKETNNVRPVKEGDWMNHDDIITLSNYVKISKRALNDIEDLDDGIWSEDFQPKIDELWRFVRELEKRITDLENLHWGDFKTIPKDKYDIKFHNGCRVADDGYGTTGAYLIDNGGNNVVLKLRYVFGNSSAGQLQCSGGVLEPWENRQNSFCESINFKGEYAYLNNLKKLSVISDATTPWFEPRSVRAGYLPTYEMFGSNSYCNYGFNCVLASVADGWGDLNTWANNYPQPLYMQGQTVNFQISMRKDVTE